MTASKTRQLDFFNRNSAKKSPIIRSLKRFTGPLCCSMAALLYAAPAQAKIISYCVQAKTADVTDAGTTGYPEIAMSGEVAPGQRIFSGWKEIGGDQDRDSLDQRTFSIDDMGVVTRIDVRNDSGNAWKLHYIRIYRNTTCGNVNGADGSSEFAINKWLEDNKSHGFDPSHRTNARVTISKEGTPVINVEKITIVNYAEVRGQREQEVMQFTESWSDIDSVGISTTQTDNVGASATLSYSATTPGGTFGAEASAEWSREISTASEKSSEKMKASEYYWGFIAPGNTFVIKKATFEVPYSHQVYRGSNDGKPYVIRTVGAQISPAADAGSFLEIPQRGNDGSITSIGLDDLQQNWFVHMDKESETFIRRNHLNKWLAAGYVERGAGGNVINQNTSKPDPVAPPKPISTPTPSPNPPKPNPSSASDGPSTGPVKGPTVKTVKFNNGAAFVNVSDGVWHELRANGNHAFTFQEMGRDEWSVYLQDKSRGYAIQLDLWRKEIIFSEIGGAKSVLAKVSGSSNTK